jgi:glycosyl transferase, family 25
MTPQTSPRYEVFVLTLEDDVSRRARLLARLERFCIPFRLHLAIDGRSGLPQMMEPLIDRAHAEAAIRRRVTDAEWACALSHRAIYQRIVDEDLPGAVILEDDARIGPRLARFIQGQGYLAAEIVLLDHHLLKPALARPKPVPGPALLLHLRKNPCLTTGYSISRRAAEMVLGQTSPLRGLADWPCDITRLGAMAAMPRLVGHPPFQSEASHIRPERTEAIAKAKAKGTLGRFE